MTQIDIIRSSFNQLTTWEQYRDLLIETLTASGYPNLDAIIRSEFDENHFDNPELLAQFIVPLFSPHSEVANHLYSGTDPLNLLVRIDRSRELVLNGTFDVDATGWSAYNSGLSVSDGELVVEGTDTDGQGYYRPVTEVGARYLAKMDLRRGTAAGNAGFRVQRGSPFTLLASASNSTTVAQTLSLEFVAIASFIDIVAIVLGDGTGTIIADNVSVRRID